MEDGVRVFPCLRSCERVFRTPGSRGMHHKACGRKAGDVPMCHAEDVFMNDADEEELSEAADSADEDPELYVDAQEEADADDVADGELPAGLPPPPEMPPAVVIGNGSNLFYERQRATGGAFIKGPLQRVLDLPAATLRLAKSFYHPKVNLSKAGMAEMVGLVKDPMFCQNQKRVPSVASVVTDVNKAVSRDQDTATKRTKVIDLQALKFPARFSTIAFTWTCIIALCVELLLDPRICNAENMQFESTYDGRTYGELPSGAWWAGEEVNNGY